MIRPAVQEFHCQIVVFFVFNIIEHPSKHGCTAFELQK